MTEIKSRESSITKYALFPLLLTISSLAAGQSPPHHPQGKPVVKPVVTTTTPVLLPATDFESIAPEGKTMHVLVGHSMFINTRHRLTKVYITNPAVLDSYTASPNQMVITAKEPGESSLIVWDESNESHTYMISSDIDIDRLRSSLKELMPEEHIDATADEGRIVLAGTVSTDALSKEAVKLAGLYSKDVSDALVTNSATIKQVQLKVRIVEVDRTKATQLGFNFFSAGGNNLAQTSTTQFPSTMNVTSAGGGSSSSGTSSSTAGGKNVSITNPLNFLFYSSKLNIGATLQDMENKQVLQILAEPTITTLSGQEANFLAGGEFPFPVVQGSLGGLTSVTVQFRPYGVKVAFTPLVNPDGTIQLKVAPEVSALDYTNQVTISGYVIPALSTRRADTEVVLKSGQTFAISGLLDKRTTDAFGRTPGIASVPILGELFKSKSLNHSTTELVVLVTPTVVNPMTEGPAIEEPKPAIPPMNPDAFDTSLPKQKPTK